MPLPNLTWVPEDDDWVEMTPKISRILFNEKREHAQFKEMKDALTWGTYGPTRRRCDLRLVPASGLADSHIINILRSQPQIYTEGGTIAQIFTGILIDRGLSFNQIRELRISQPEFRPLGEEDPQETWTQFKVRDEDGNTTPVSELTEDQLRNELCLAISLLHEIGDELGRITGGSSLTPSKYDGLVH